MKVISFTCYGTKKKSLGVAHINFQMNVCEKTHEYVKTLKRIETYKTKGCLFCPSCSYPLISEFLILENRNNGLCLPSPALKRLDKNEGNGVYHKNAPPYTTSSPGELFVT